MLHGSVVLLETSLPASIMMCSAGVKRVLVPKRNWRDIQADVPASVRDNLEIIPVNVLEDVLQHAFDPPLLLKPTAKL